MARSESAVVVGIHVAASRPSVAVALRGGRTLDVTEWREAAESEPGDHGRLLEWITSLGPAAVGIDAPQRPRRASAGSGSAAALRCRAAGEGHRRVPGADGR